MRKLKKLGEAGGAQLVMGRVWMREMDQYSETVLSVVEDSFNWSNVF